MRLLYKFSIYAFLALMVFSLGVGCTESPELSVDPEEEFIPFTFQPLHGYPGTQVAIEGRDFSGVDEVAFGNVSAEIVSKSNDRMVVKVPVGAASGLIKLVSNGIVLSSGSDFLVDESPIPSIMEFSPAIAGSGEVITITGSLFDEVIAAYIGDLEAEILEGGTDAEIQIVTPEGLQTGNIRLKYKYMTSYGIEQEAESRSAVVLTLALPSISSVEPGLTGLNIEETMTIHGSYLELVDIIRFGDVEVLKEDFELVDGVITVAVPMGATSGTLTLIAEDGVYEHTSSFAVKLPSISSFTPQKGSEEPGGTRPFSILGSHLDFVDSVMIGSDKAQIVSQLANQLLVSVGGSTSGIIHLHSPNGIVSSTAPFAFVGDFWVNDWDTTFDVARFSHLANNNLGSFEANVVADNGNNYVEVTMGNFGSGNSFYMWGADPGNDKFSLYVSSPAGVFLEFDMKVSSIDEAIKQEDGTFEFKIYLMDALGWGASGEHAYGYNGPTSYVRSDGEWQTFRMDLSGFKASNNSGLYTTGQVDEIAGAFVHPNSIRIITYVFGFDGEEGDKGNAVVGIDNVKFVIE